MNVGIVGAGIMGRMLSWHLARDGHAVALFDRDDVRSDSERKSAAGYTAAGMLTPYAELESAEPMIFDLGMRSLDLWPQIMADLGISDAYFQEGSLVVAHPNDRADYERFKSHVGSKLASKDIAHAEIDRSRIDELEPELSSQFHQAMYFSEESWLRSGQVMDALLEGSTKVGCTSYPKSEVTELQAGFVVANSIKYRFDYVIDCRGLGAKADIQNLRGVRGELIWLEAPDVHINRLVRLMHPRYGLYLVPQKQDNLFIVGATQIESDDAGEMTVRSAMELLSAAYSIHPGFGEARIVQMKTNCRPALADNLPTIENQDGLIRVNGLFRHGYLLAPALAMEVVNLINETDHQTASRTAVIN